MLLLDKKRRHLDQAFADNLARLFRGFEIIFFQRLDIGEYFALHADQQLTRARAHNRIGRHQLRVRKALVDILIDDVRLI